MGDKKRSAPVTEEEKNILLECVEEQRAIVENKKSDGTTIGKKAKAWEAIAVAFNSYLNVQKRNSFQLRKAYNNIKARHKRSLAEESRHRMATGGGPSRPDIVQPPSLIEVLAPGILHSVQDEFDSDFAGESLANAVIEPSQEPSNDNNECVTHSGPTIESDNDDEPTFIGQMPSSSNVPKKFSRLQVLRAEHQLRSEQLQDTVDHTKEIHAIRIKEANSSAEEANARARTAAIKEETARLEQQHVKLQIQMAEEQAKELEHQERMRAISEETALLKKKKALAKLRAAEAKAQEAESRALLAAIAANNAENAAQSE